MSEGLSRGSLLARTLRFFAAPNAAVVLGVVAATAAIAGALVVGDSVRGSLRQMTLDRLGRIEKAVTPPRFVLEKTVEAAGGVPTIQLTGTLRSGGRVAGSVTVVALPVPLEELWPDAGATPAEGGIVLNARVAAALEAGVGDEVSVVVETPSSVPRDALLGERDETLTEAFRTVTAVLPEGSGAGRFSLSPGQQLPAVAFVRLGGLQADLGVNAVEGSRRFAGRPARVNAGFWPVGGAVDAEERLSEAATLDDLDLRLVRTPGGGLSVESRAQILAAAFAEAAGRAAETLGLRSSGVLVYLVNEIANAADPAKFSTYSVLAGVEPAVLSDSPPGKGVVVNEWLAEDLGVSAGDAITVTYFEVGDTGELPEKSETLPVSGVVPLAGAAADRTLTPSVPGITDADTFSDWDQPFEMALSRVTPRDEDYWDEYRATPKLFLSLEEAEARFGSRYGSLTSVRVFGGEEVDEAAFAAALLAELSPREAGLAVLPVREQQLAASAGTTDFSGLFFGFSMFLIAAALLLIGLLFRLGMERRAGQLGLLRAVGFGPAAVGRLVYGEGLALACVGALLGLAAAVAFAFVMIEALTGRWGGAVNTTFLSLHVRPASLLIGFVASVAAAAAAMVLAVRGLKNLSVRSLMAGRAAEPPAGSERSRLPSAKSVAVAALAAAAVLVAGLLVGLIPDAEAFSGFSWRVVGFFVVGVCLLTAATAAFAALLSSGESAASLSLSRLGWRNTGRARSRSLLTAALVAFATFVLVAVAVARKDPAAEGPKIDSGDGGYRFVAEAAAPILYDVGTTAGREDAVFLADAEDAAFESADIVSLRVRPGDDASCLNLYSARLPTLLGVPGETLRRWDAEGRFAFADTPGESPWLSLLETPPGEVPVIGDMNTLLYSLKTGVGRTFPVPEDVRAGTDLRVTGMLDGSVFQGVLLTSAENLRRIDPAVVGFRYFLVEAPADSGIDAVLEEGLADYGFDAERVGDRIAGFLAVQNTYLSTFQVLGGLGLLLGTLGLGAVMLRNVSERTGELALMRSVGYRRSRLGLLVLGENTLLLAYGLASGAAAALVAMLPHLSSRSADVPWASLGGLLLAVLAAGTLAGGAAVWRATRTPLLAALNSE